MRTMVCQRALVVMLGVASGLGGCAVFPGSRAVAPRPVAYAHGHNPCVEFAEDIFGRRYCRRHAAD